MSEDETTWLNTRLGPEEEAEFAAIQRRIGIKRRSDVIRYLIHQEALRLFSAPLPLMDVRKEASR